MSDADGDLSSVDLSLTDDTDGASEDSATLSVSESSASGTTRLVAAGDDGSGDGYTVDLTVTDGNGNSTTDSTSVSETESMNSAPVVDAYNVGEAGSPNPFAGITADWTVSDGDGNLDSVVVDVVNADTGSVVDSSTTDVSGSSASGSDSFNIKRRNETYDVVLTVTDGVGATDSATRTVTE